MRTAVLLFLTAVLSGCASIMGVEEYAYRIESDPPGQPYTVRDRSGIEVARGTTPDTIMLESGQRFFRKQEYDILLPDQDLSLKSSYTVGGWYIGNFVFGWIIGLFIVDPASGAMYIPERFSIESGGAKVTISEGKSGPMSKEERKKIVQSDGMYL